MSTPNLWPEKLDDIEESFAISSIKEQAELLPRQTGNLVKAELVPLTWRKAETFEYDFDLIVPALDYRFTLFMVLQSVEGFPVFLIPYSKIRDELKLPPIDVGGQPPRHAIQADDEAGLIEALRRILGSHTTKRILQTLMAQAKEFKLAGHDRSNETD